MKKLLTILTMLCVTTVMSAATTNYDLWFDGIQVTSSNANRIHDSSYIKYNASTKTLTLENIIFTARTAEVIKSEIDGLTIKVIGTVNLWSTAADKSTFLLKGNTKIVGSGVGASTLNITRNDATGSTSYQPIRANCSIEIKDITMKVSNAKGGTAIRPYRTPDDATNPSAYTLSITNADVTFGDGGTSYPICGFKNVYLSGCSLNPMTYYKTDANSYYVADKSGKGVKGDIVIKNRYYGTFGDVEINDKNASSIKPSDLKNGMIYLRDFAKGAGKYILLDNVDFLSTMHYGLYLDPTEECEFQIILRGKNTITASKPVFLSQKATPTVLIKPSAGATDTPTLNLIQNKSSDYVMDVRCPELIFSNINLLIESKDGGSIGGYPSDRLLSFVNTKAEIFDIPASIEEP